MKTQSNRRLLLAHLLLVIFFVSFGASFAQGIRVVELPGSNNGDRWLLYYLNGDEADEVRLAVRLARTPAGLPIAQVYDAPAGLDHVQVTVADGVVSFPSEQLPTITVISRDPNWLDGGMVSYNLDVSVRGPVQAIWSPGFDVDYANENWQPVVPRGTLAVEIAVRSGSDGFPRWDLREIVPVFPSRGYYRTNYAERKCSTPLQPEASVSPQWPYVAADGGYEQPNGQLRPPIVVDWERGKVTHFAELVTVRNQNCSFSLYSISRVEEGRLNKPNFESPFAFYDLSGEGSGFPNLVIRTERHPAGDEWLVGPRRVDRDFKAIRYSWRNEVGDLLWDYKVEVLGFHPFDYETQLAGGTLLVDLPSYEDYPSWVVNRSWPVTVFIDTEELGYRSSEGIYAWSTREVGDEYALGWSADANPAAFSQIQAGLRGEFRFTKTLQPELYMSPIDNRLHLTGADGGVWDLGSGRTVVVEDRSGDGHVDHWLLTGPDDYAELADLGGFLVFADAAGIRIGNADFPTSLFAILPPTDRESWREVRELLAPYESQRRDPLEMVSWFEALTTSSAQLESAQLERISIDEGGFQLVLVTDDEVVPSGADLFGFETLPTGRVRLAYSENSAEWSAAPAEQEPLEAGIVPARVIAFTPAQFTVTINNPGTIDLRAPVRLRVGEFEVFSSSEWHLAAGEETSQTFSWTPVSVGSQPVTLTFGSQVIDLGQLQVAQQPRVGGLEAITTLQFGHAVLWQIVVLTLILSASLASLWVAWSRQ